MLGTRAASDLIPHAAGRPWFYANELAKIYQFPDPSTAATPIVIGVISFGGGLYGTTNSSGVLTAGDVLTYWRSLGMTSLPRVIVKLVGGARNTPASNADATAENTLDVETIGACYPSSALTIVLYIYKNAYLTSFKPVVLEALTKPVVVAGVKLPLPSIISISWGAPEEYFGSLALDIQNTVFAPAAARGVNITCATGDFGSSDGIRDGRPHCDFPSSSPSVIACGGTTLVCPTGVYDGAGTMETAWTSGGGGVSKLFASPSFQAGLGFTKRAIPDVCMNADPATGVRYLVNGRPVVYGGTSVVAPAMAALLAGKRKTFAAPRLYAGTRAAFHDIVSGSNGAYMAGLNYDVCTGLGSINGDVLGPVLL
jgi:kumamolisin